MTSARKSPRRTADGEVRIGHRFKQNMSIAELVDDVLSGAAA